MTREQDPPVDAAGQSLSAAFLHDLRTPLNQIIGYSEMLIEQAQEEGQTGFVPDLEEIHTASLQLLDLLNNGTPAIPNRVTPTSKPSTPAPLEIVQPESLGELPLSGAAPARILVVDDIKRNRDLLSRRL